MIRADYRIGKIYDVIRLYFSARYLFEGSVVISVLSNVLPKETVAICKKFFAGDVAGAMELQKKYLALTNALFSEVNPIPAKAAMAALGFCEDYLRLPLVPMSEGKRAHLLECMRELNLL